MAKNAGLPVIISTNRGDRGAIRQEASSSRPPDFDFLVLDFNPRTGLSFFREGGSDFELNVGKVGQRRKVNPHALRHKKWENSSLKEKFE